MRNTGLKLSAGERKGLDGEENRNVSKCQAAMPAVLVSSPILSCLVAGRAGMSFNNIVLRRATLFDVFGSNPSLFITLHVSLYRSGR